MRDFFLNLDSKDYDIEVYGLDKIKMLENILKKYGSVSLVGKSFGVLKFAYKKEKYDFSFPRLEEKIAKGHRGFNIFSNGNLDFKQASLRRDFTINAMGYDIEKKQFLDPFNAKEDIKNKILRHIKDETFIEDPLRVYRAVQFCARFKYKLDPSTYKLCQTMVSNGSLEELPKERIFTEWNKLLLKSKQPSIGFELMRDLNILQYFPELKAIIGILEDKKTDLIDDVWTHTMRCIDIMAKQDNNHKKLYYMYAILCHDLGKAQLTKQKINNTNIIKTFLYRLSYEKKWIDSILPLVDHHLKPSIFYKNRSNAKAILKLAIDVNIEDLVIVAKVDFLGQLDKKNKTDIYEAGEWLLSEAQRLNVKNKALKCVLQGRDLIKIGLKPSKEFKNILSIIYEAQLDGKIKNKEEALLFLKDRLNE